HHLGAHQHVRIAGEHLIKDQVGGIRRLHHVPIESNHPGGWKQGSHLLLDALGANTEAFDETAAAGGAAAWHWLAAAAVMALQPAQGGVVDERHATVRALANLAAIAAQDEGGQAAAVQKENRLLATFQGSSHGRLEVLAGGAEMAG